MEPGKGKANISAATAGGKRKIALISMASIASLSGIHDLADAPEIIMAKKQGCIPAGFCRARANLAFIQTYGFMILLLA